MEQDRTKPRIVSFDLEVSPALGYFYPPTWETGILETVDRQKLMNFAWQIVGEKKISAKNLSQMPNYKKDMQDDKELVIELHKVLSSADILLGQNSDCVSVDSMVLMRDLTWKRAGDVKDGDEIIGFDEGVVPGQVVRNIDGGWNGAKKTRRLKFGTVYNHENVIRDCVKVMFASGRSVVTTKEHYWLGMAEKDKNHRWYKSEYLRVGQRVPRYFDVWGTNNSYEAGWLSGFISGEGTLKKTKTAINSIDFCQTEGATLSQAKDFATKLGYDFSEPTHKNGGLGTKNVYYSWNRGGKFETMRIIGELRIQRFIDKLTSENLGCLKNGVDNGDTIVSVEDVGPMLVSKFETTCKTFFADGYPMHNCFDVKMANYFFLLNDLEPIPPVKYIDTKKIAKRYFRFMNNTLDNLGKEMGFGGKTEITYKDLWIPAFLNGDAKAWKMLDKYCKNDVDKTTKIYLKMRPFMHQHPSLARISGDWGSCPRCGGYQHRVKAYRTTNTSRYRQYQCLECLGFFSDRKAITENEGDIKPIYTNV